MTASKSAPKQLALPASRTYNQVSIATLRTHLTTLTFHSPYLSDAEKLRANHRIHDCEQLAQLELWLQTIPAELAWREATYNVLYEPCSADDGQRLSLNTPLLHC
jgi:hypothetical protein